MKPVRIAALCLVLLLSASCEQEAGVRLWETETAGEEPEAEEPSPAFLAGISIASLPETIYYARGQVFDPEGLSVEGVFVNEQNGGESRRALDEAEYELLVLPPDMNQPGPKYVEVRSGEHTGSFPVIVSSSDAVLDSISVTQPESGLVQYLGESFNLAALDVRGIFRDKDGDTEEKSLGLYSVDGYDSGKRGLQELTIRANGKTAAVPLTVKIPASAEVSLAAVVGTDTVIKGQVNNKPKVMGHNNAFIRGQDLDMANAKFRVQLNVDGASYALMSGYGIDSKDIGGFDKDKAGFQTVTLALDELEVPVEVYVADLAPEVYFDYGFWRHENDPSGLRGGDGCHTVPGRPVVLSPARVLIGYDKDNNDVGAEYAWTVTTITGGNPAVSESTDKEFLTLTPQGAGKWRVGVTVTGRNFIDGGTVSRSAETLVVCDEAKPAAAAPNPSGPHTSAAVKNFSPGQFTEGGLGAGWSLGTIGGYDFWPVVHRQTYTIKGNDFAGWTEAGIVWFQEDLNGNGKADEVWYEAYAGTSTPAAPVTRRYSITFFKSDDPDSETSPAYGGQKHREVYWADCKGRTDMIPGGWPWQYGSPNHKGAWVTYTSTLLDDDGEINSEDYTYSVPGDGGPFVDHGSPEIPISRAVAADGSSVTLSRVRFVKVQTAVFKYGSVFGEISTEIALTGN